MGRALACGQWGRGDPEREVGGEGLLLTSDPEV